MRKFKPFAFIALLFFSLLFLAETASARSWDDLREDNEDVFGSEKAMRYNPDMFFFKRETWDDHYSLMFLWLFKYTDYPKYTSVRVLPFYYEFDSKIDNRSLAFIPILLTYWEIDGNAKFKINPLFISKSNNNQWQNSSGLTFNYKEQYSYSLLHAYRCYSSDSGDPPDKTWWAPIVPLIYRSTDKSGGHMNILWLLDYKWNRDVNGEQSLERFFLLPLVYFDDKAFTDTFYSLLFSSTKAYYSSNKTEKDLARSSFWFPIIPLFYHSKASDGSRTNILWLIDWKKNEYGDMQRFFFIPFVFHKYGEDGYKIYFPFFISIPSAESEDSGTVYSPFYYHDWSPTKDTKWRWLINYKRNDTETGEYLNTWFPFYYYHQKPTSETTMWIFPLYYNYDGREYSEHVTRIVTPLYWHKENSVRKSTLFLPLYFETAKKDGSSSFYVNILGYSRSVLAGTSPLIDAGFGINQKGAYIDVDVSWLIGVFNISTRVTVPLNDNAIETENEATTGQVTITDKKDRSRESSINFWGFHLMFGLFAFEKADNKRHLRMLPLSWITWDTESDDQLKVIFNYLSYKNTETDTDYLVFFPFYGSQRIGESYKKGYLLNLYWREYDHETDLNEYTVFWPVFNRYSSPSKNGWRLLPFVWHKESEEDNILYSSTYTPVYINRSQTNINDNSKFSKFNISLLHFYMFNSDENKSLKMYFSIIPIIFNYEQKAVNTRVFETAEDEPIRHTETFVAHERLRWFLPFFMSHKKSGQEVEEAATTTNYTLFGLPLLYYNSFVQTGANEAEKTQRSKFFLMGYYHKKSPEESYTNFMLWLYSSRRSHLSDDYSYGLFFGLFNISDEKGTHKNYFRPFYYFARGNGFTEYSVLMGLYRVKQNEETGERSRSFVYNMFNSSLANYELSQDADEETRKITERKRWAFPIFYYSIAQDISDGAQYERKHSFSLFHYNENIRSVSAESSTFWFPIIPLYYSHDDAKTSRRNVLGIIDYKTDLISGNTRFWIIPLFFSKTGNQGYYHFAPFYFSFWNHGTNDYHKIIMGLSLRDNPWYKSQNFLYLYEHKLDKKYEQHEYSFLFRTLKFSIDNQRDIFKQQALWGFLTDIEWMDWDDYSFKALLYLAAVENGKNYLHTRALPFWYYERYSTAHTLVVPPALLWDAKEINGDRFQLWGLGAVWFRNYKPHKGSDFQALLAGIPYYKTQKRERGYESRGSLWGLLWEYETEAETGFSKFSLLKFLYKRTEIDGEVQHNVLGISF